MGRTGHREATWIVSNKGDIIKTGVAKFVFMIAFCVIFMLKFSSGFLFALFHPTCVIYCNAFYLLSPKIGLCWHINVSHLSHLIQTLYYFGLCYCHISVHKHLDIFAILIITFIYNSLLLFVCFKLYSYAWFWHKGNVNMKSPAIFHFAFACCLLHPVRQFI